MTWVLKPEFRPKVEEGGESDKKVIDGAAPDIDIGGFDGASDQKDEELFEDVYPSFATDDEDVEELSSIK